MVKVIYLYVNCTPGSKLYFKTAVGHKKGLQGSCWFSAECLYLCFSPQPLKRKQSRRWMTCWRATWASGTVSWVRTHTVSLKKYIHSPVAVSGTLHQCTVGTIFCKAVINVLVLIKGCKSLSKLFGNDSPIPSALVFQTDIKIPPSTVKKTLAETSD